jgi:GNAT superfamily N-acetyltransferase
MRILSWNAWRRRARQWARPVLAALPERLRFALYRRAVECDPVHGDRLELKIAETEAELEACFKLLHDAYVASGFMQPHPSGLRITPYHALPTTTTLCAKIDGQVVGTLSIVREGVFGFPMQSVFDIAPVRAKGGRLAEISALAIHPRFRRTGGSILFPLMKFMYEYCTQYFDTRHLLIAVNPAHIEMYESLLFFRRLTEAPVERYDFVNGAPAVGATLDLEEAPELFRRAYAHKPGRRNLHRFFVDTRLQAIRFPSRPWHTSNDPVLTPALLDHFFNQRTDVLAQLDERGLRLLHAIYPGADWAAVLAPLQAVSEGNPGTALRRHPRYTTKCPATLQPLGITSGALRATLVEISAEGFQARVHRPLAVGTRCSITTELGPGVRSQVAAMVVREVSSDSGQTFGFHVAQPDAAWQRCVNWLERNGLLPADGMPVAPLASRVTRQPAVPSPRPAGVGLVRGARSPEPATAAGLTAEA